MKNSNFKIMLVLVALMSTTLFFCKKDDTPADPNEGIVVKREIVVSALNAFTQDSISSFDVKITTPTTTISKTSTGNTLAVTDLVAGTYKIIVSKSGFTTSEEQEITVVLPTDPKVALILPSRVLLTKTATPVVVTGATGGTITVKEDAGTSSSAPVAAAEVQPGTTFTLADGSKPASVSISVTNIPVNTAVAPVESVNGVSTLVVPDGIEVIDNKIPSTKLNLQPEGLVLSQPMIVSVDLTNKYPTTMSLAEKTARQAGLTMNYERKDGTFETITPDHFSADRNTVYYKISHFSQWSESNSNVTFVKEKRAGLSPLQNAVGACGAAFDHTFEYSFIISDIRIIYPLFGATASQQVAMTVDERIKNPLSSGFYSSVNWQCAYETYILTDSTPGYSITATVIVPLYGVSTKEYVACHQQ